MATPKNSPEKINLYKGKEKEVLDGLEKKGYDSDKIKKRLDEIKKIEAKDKQTLEKVEAGSKEHIELIKKILDKKEKEKGNIIEQAKDKIDEVKDTVEKKVEQKVDEVKDNATKTILEKTGIGAIMDKFTGFFDKFTGFFDTLWKKITAALAGTALGGWLGFKKENENDEEKEENNNDESKDNNQSEISNAKNEDAEKNNPDLKKEETKKPLVSPETKKEIQYISGIKTLLSLTGIKTETNVDKKGILDKIKNLKYNNLINLEESEKDKFLGGDKKETFDKILEQFNSEKFKTLASYNFKSKFLEKIIKDDNGEINKKLADKIDGGKKRLEEILTKSANSDKNPEWWRDTLSIEEISLLYTSSFNILSIPTIPEFDFKSKLGLYFFDKDNTIDEVENNFVSKKIISGFGKKLGPDFGSKDYLTKDNKIRENVGIELNENEKEQLNKIIDFKDYILEEYLTDFEPKLNEEQKRLFKNNLDYKWIITLYSLLKGKHFDKDISIINKFSLIFLNSKIIGGAEGSKYIGKNIYDWYSDGSVLNDEEKKVLGIYKDKFVDIMIFQNINEIGKKLGLASGLTNTDLETLAMGLGGSGTLSYIIGNKMIKKKLEKGGISMLGVFAKKAGIVGIFGGLAIGGYTFYNKDHLKNTIGEDLKKEENNPKELLKILENYKNSIYDETIDGKRIQIIKYKNDTPLIKMDGKIFTFDFIDTSIWEKIQNKESIGDIIKSALKSVLSILPDSKDIKINGQTIDRTKVKIKGEKIIFGDNIKYNLKDLFEGISDKEIQLDESTINIINNFLKDKADKTLPVSGKDTYYYPLKKLPNGKILSLVQIGEINQQKNGK